MNDKCIAICRNIKKIGTTPILFITLESIVLMPINGMSTYKVASMISSFIISSLFNK